MKGPVLLLSAFLFVAGSAMPAAAEVTIAFHDGKVTILAHNATLRQVLAAWEASGGTRIKNREQVPNLAVSIDLVDVPEARALATLLRPLTGFIASPRRTPVEGASTFAHLVVVPSLAPPPQAAPAVTPPRPGMPSGNPPFRMVPGQNPGMMSTPGDFDDDPGDERSARPPSQRVIRETDLPDPNADDPQTAPGTGMSATPSVPGAVTVAVPGVLTKPKTPGQPPAPPQNPPKLDEP
jgi:hypothetical protein